MLLTAGPLISAALLFILRGVLIAFQARDTTTDLLISAAQKADALDSMISQFKLKDDISFRQPSSGHWLRIIFD